MATKHSSEVESTALAANDLAQTLKALAAPQRLRILALLGDSQLGASELSAALGLSRAQVRRNLRARCRPGESLLGRCWVAYTTSTLGWLRDSSRYGCNFGTPQVLATVRNPRSHAGVAS